MSDQEWINAKDKLPNNTHVVIGWEKTWGMSLFSYFDDKWNYAHNVSRRGSERVLYWRPLPEPPKDES